MGSANITMTDLPVATSPSVVLAHPTEDEKRQTWGMTTSEWAGALTPEQYLEREQYLVTMPVNRDGGITHWILTTSDDDTTEAGSNSDSKRPLLSSCESIMKKILVASPTGDGTVTEEIGHGIGGVYTSTEFRGRSYASRMLAEVGAQLENWDLAPQGAGISNSSSKKKKAICSALWSDIGKKFYAKKGWVPFASQHVEFLAGDFHHETSAAKTKLPSTPITYGNIADFCALDEAALREKLARTAHETGKTAMAFSPSHDQMLWHLYRDSYIASLVFPDRDPHLADAEDGKNNNTTNGRGDSPSSSSSPSRQPRSAAALRRHPGELEANEVKGIAVGPVGQRVWAIWTRNFSKGPSSPKDNTLYILRLVVENENQQQHGADDAQLVESFVAVIRAAQTAAQQWSCGRVDLWNPEGAVARLLRDSGLEHEVVEREEASIPSLMWYGEGTKSEDVVWLSNEKYCWC